MDENSDGSFTESEYACVVFNDVEETYTPGKDINCRFTFKTTVEPSSRDWVGVFRVGWTSPRDYYTYQWYSHATKVETNDSENEEATHKYNIVFFASSLPQEDEEFYQFCYVTGSGDIRGASCPFQMKAYHPEDEIEICEYEDEEGISLMVVKNRTAILEESLAQAGEEMAALKSDKETLKSDNESLKETILEMEASKVDYIAEITSLKQVNLEVKEAHEKAIQEYVDKCSSRESEILALNDNVSCLENCNQELEKRVEEQNGKIEELNKMLQEEVQRKDETNKNKEKLVEEKMQFLQSMADDRKMIDELRNNCKKFQTDLHTVNQELNQMKKSCEEMKHQHEEEKTILTNTSTEKENQMKSAEKDACELALILKETQSELDSSKERVKVLIGQLRRHESDSANIKQALDEATSDLTKQIKIQEKLEMEAESFENKITDMSNLLKSKEEDCESLELEIEEMRNELRSTLENNELIKNDYETQLRMLHEQLEGQTALNNSLCLASDKQISDLQEELMKQLKISTDLAKRYEEQTSYRNGSEEKLDSTKNEVKNLQDALDQVNTELKLKSAEQEKLRKDKADQQTQRPSNSIRGSFMALQTAYGHLEKQLNGVKKERDDLWRQRNELKRQLLIYQNDLPQSDLRHSVDELRAKVEDLRMRLRMGADAYKEKFMECNKLQSKLKKLQSNKEGTSSSDSFQAELMEKAQQDLADEKVMVQAMKEALQVETETSVKKMAQMEEAYMKVVNERATLQRKLEEVLGGSITLEHRAIQQAEDSSEKVKEECDRLNIQVAELEKNLDAERKDKEEVIQCLTNQMKTLQEKLTITEKDSGEITALRDALAESEEQREKLREMAADRIRQYIERENEHQEKIRNLEVDVERWKQETQMHVNAAVEFVKKENAEENVEVITPTGELVHEEEQQQSQHQQSQQGYGAPWPLNRLPGFQPPPNTRSQCPGWTFVNHPTNPSTVNMPQGLYFGAVPPVTGTPPTNPQMMSRGPDSNPQVDDAHCCPVCRVYFPPSKEAELQEHVNRHFES